MALLFRSQPKRECWDSEKWKSGKVSKEICYVGAGMRGEEEKGVDTFLLLPSNFSYSISFCSLSSSNPLFSIISKTVFQVA